MTGARPDGPAPPAPNAAPIVEADALVRRYGPVTAVDGVSFSVGRGEMFGLIGPDGAGKTSTLRMVLGLLAPHGGRVTSCGLVPHLERRALSGRVGYLSQRFSLYGDLSVDDNVAFFAVIHGVRGWRESRDEILGRLRLAEFRDRLADRLSGGMRQKLALACTLIHRPELLVLDEPTTGVDPVSRREFWRLLVGLQRDGLSILLTTPYLDEAERCQRVGLLDRGKILALDAPDAIRAAAPGATVEVLARPRPRAAALLRARPGVTEVEVFGERLHVTLAGVPAAEGGRTASEIAASLAAAGIEVESSRAAGATLEDVFIARIREGLPGGSLDQPGVRAPEPPREATS